MTYLKALLFSLFILMTVNLLNASAQVTSKSVSSGVLSEFDDILKSGKVLGSVYFNERDSSLDSEAKRVLAEIAKKLLALEGPYIVRVEGYSDSISEKKSGILLSIQRSQSVKLYMSMNFPGIKSDVYMTGFGESRPVILDSSVSGEDAKKMERRVDLVVYSGAKFFEEPEAMKLVKKIRPKSAPPAPVVTVSIIRRKRQSLVFTKSLKRVILPESFFSEDGLLKEEARPALRNVLSKVKDGSGWLFLSASSASAVNAGSDGSLGLTRQINTARELASRQGIDSDRIFIHGLDPLAFAGGSEDGKMNAVYLYLPIQ